MLRLFSILLALAMLSGCCSRTTLILLPEEGEETGRVVISTTQSELELDEPYSYVEVAATSQQPGDIARITPEDFQRRWGDLVKQEPPRPRSFILYFYFGSIEITEESIALLPEVINTIQQAGPVEVTIIGHTDAVGNEEYNYKLSVDRAEVIHELLLAHAPWLTNVTVESYGQKDPLVPTLNNVAEPRNRRVEILIR